MRLGKELLRTVEGILGAQADAYVLSNDGYSGEALSRAIEERVHGVPVERPVVPSPISPRAAAASRRAARMRREGGPEVTGVNLKLLESSTTGTHSPWRELLRVWNPRESGHHRFLTCRFSSRGSTTA